MFFLEKMIDKRIAAYQSGLLATHYAEVENMYRRMRGWRHDYRNHIQVLKSYADMGALDDIRRYLDELETDLNTVDMALKTGNKMTDIMKGKTTKKYGVFANALYMLRTAKDTVPSVIVLTVLQAVLAVAVSVLELYVAPVILRRLEAHSALPKLVLTILFFTLGITSVCAVPAYVNRNINFGRIEVRERLMQRVRVKAGTCSYPLRERQEFADLWTKALDTLNDNNKASEAIWNTFAELLQNITGFLIYLYLLKNVDMVVVVVTVITAAAGYLVCHRANEWNCRHQEEEAAITKKILYVQERAKDRGLAKDIRIFGMQEWLRELHDKYFRLYQSFCGRRELRYFCADAADAILGTLRNGIAYAASAAVSRIFMGIVYLFVCLKAWGGAFGVGSVTQYIGAVTALSGGLAKILEIMGEIGINAVYLKQAFLFLDIPNRLYDPTEGEILLNGIDIRKYNYHEYMNVFSVVFQDFKLLSLPVGQNIAAREVFDVQKAESCCRKAGIRERVASMENGLDTFLYKDLSEEGVRISGGEEQKLAIARALYRDSAFLILDEPTAALDPMAEYEIYTRLNEIVEDKTAIYISHRLSSCRFCDEIIVFHEGHMVQQGSHEALLVQKEGKYSELWNAQAQYYVTAE